MNADRATEPHQEAEVVHLETIYRALLRIVAHFDEAGYSQSQLRQTEVVEHSDLADPASAEDTPQG